MRTIKKKASVIRLKYTPSAGWLDINFGGEIFRLLKGEDFSKQKIVYPDISERLNFQIIEDEFFFNNTIYFITSHTEELSYLLKFLNSKLIDWYYKSLSVQLGEKAVRMFTIYVLNIPIPKKGNRDNIYESYQLTDEEIEFIESLYCN